MGVLAVLPIYVEVFTPFSVVQALAVPSVSGQVINGTIVGEECLFCPFANSFSTVFTVVGAGGHSISVDNVRQGSDTQYSLSSGGGLSCRGTSQAYVFVDNTLQSISSIDIIDESLPTSSLTSGQHISDVVFQEICYSSGSQAILWTKMLSDGRAGNPLPPVVGVSTFQDYQTFRDATITPVQWLGICDSNGEILGCDKGSFLELRGETFEVITSQECMNDAINPPSCNQCSEGSSFDGEKCVGTQNNLGFIVIAVGLVASFGGVLFILRKEKII